MKEEMCESFELRNPFASYEGWKRWFDAVEVSGIQPLVKLAHRKRSHPRRPCCVRRFPYQHG